MDSTTSTPTLSHSQFVSQLRSKSLPLELFDHAARIRVAWFLIAGTKRPLGDAIREARHLITQYLRSQNVADNQTHISFYVHLVAHAWLNIPEPLTPFDQFLEMNPHLLDTELWSTYYTPGRWHGEASAAIDLSPNLRHLPRLRH